MTTVWSSLQDLNAAVTASVFGAALWISGGPRPVAGPVSTAERELHRSSLQALAVPLGPDNVAVLHCLLDHLGTAIALAASSPDLVRSALTPVTTPLTVVTLPDPMPPGGTTIATADAAGTWQVPPTTVASYLLVIDRVAPGRGPS